MPEKHKINRLKVVLAEKDISHKDLKKNGNCLDVDIRELLIATKD